MFAAALFMQTLHLILLGAAVVAVAIAAFCLFGYRQRRKHLTERYGDPVIVERMMNGVIWQGETREQLRESLGEPADLDETVLKTKTKELWKYQPTGKNRFGLKVSLEDGVVVGWEKKE